MFTSIGDYRMIDNMCDTLLAQGMDSALVLNEVQKRFYSVDPSTLADRVAAAVLVAGTSWSNA